MCMTWSPCWGSHVTIKCLGSVLFVEINDLIYSICQQLLFCVQTASILTILQLYSVQLETISLQRHHLSPTSRLSQHLLHHLNLLSLCLASLSYYLQPSKANSKPMCRLFPFYMSVICSLTVRSSFFLPLSVYLPLCLLSFFDGEEELSTCPVLSLPGLHCVCQTHCHSISLS